MLQKVKICNLQDISDTDLKKTFFAMHPIRQQKVLRQKQLNAQKQTLAGEFLARKVIEQEKGLSFEEIVILPNTNGKLYAENTSVFFSISHSGEYVAVAVADVEIGIDVEKKKSVSGKLVKRVCNEKEISYVLDYESDEAELGEDACVRFLEVWTSKEAVFKCLGTWDGDYKSIDSFSEQFLKEKYITDDYVLHIVTEKR